MNDYEDRLAILPDNGQRWGICGIQLTHSDEPEARIRCLTCCSYDCHHTRALVFQLPLAPDDDNPVAIFRQAMESPSNKSGNTTEKVYRDQKVPFFPRMTCYKHLNHSVLDDLQKLLAISSQPVKRFQRNIH